MNDSIMKTQESNESIRIIVSRPKSFFFYATCVYLTNTLYRQSRNAMPNAASKTFFFFLACVALPSSLSSFFFRNGLDVF